MLLMDRLWLGTVQIGKRYGLAQRRQSRAESFKLLDRAWAMGARRFDTARNYGDAEARIGEWVAQTGNRPVVTSKVPRMDGVEDADIPAFIAATIDDSRRDLRLERLDVYLCHDSEDFLRSVVRDALHRAVDRGAIARFGVSCYGPDEALKAIAADRDMSFIQLPASVVDRRVQQSTLLSAAAASGVTLAARSLFLQGVLLLAEDRLPSHLAGLASSVAVLRETAAGNGIPLSSLAIGYVLSRLPEAEVVLGFHTTEQLREVERFSGDFPAFEAAYAELDARIGAVPPNLIDPRRWPPT